MEKIKYYIKISFIPILVDKKQSQMSEGYHKILVDDNGDIICKTMNAERNIEDILRELFKKYLKYDYDWSFKTIASCRKVNNIIEISYVSYMPYIEDCNKCGKFINPIEIHSLEDQYYGKVISCTSPESFR